MKRFALAIIVAIGLTACGDGQAPTPSAAPSSTSPSPAAGSPGTVGPNADNSAANRNDGKSALTPIDQGSGEEDVKETTDVRKAIIADKNLSINAQNIKIITHDGRLTLRGTVNTSAERERVNQIVRDTIGTKPYDDQLNISLIK